MSDGPHRSLNMRHGWKKLAERADNSAYAPAEITDAAAPALAQDGKEDVSAELARCVCEVLGGQQDSLFRDEKVMQLEALRRVTAGHGLGQVLIDCAIQAAAKGKSGPAAAVEAAIDALNIWAARCARQVEEHYYRKSTLPRAQNVRARIEEGIRGVSFEGLARQILKLATEPVPRAPSKRSGLDDGVQL